MECFKLIKGGWSKATGHGAASNTSQAASSLPLSGGGKRVSAVLGLGLADTSDSIGGTFEKFKRPLQSQEALLNTVKSCRVKL